MTTSKKVKPHPNASEYFKELSCYDKHIDLGSKPKIKFIRNIDLFSELPFYEQMNVIKTNHAITGYAISCKVKIIRKKIETV